MEKVLGVGGVFFKAEDPAELAAWYREHLGVPVPKDRTYASLSSRGPGEVTVWSAFARDTEYFLPSDASFMVNFRVRDLDAILDQLRDAGVEVDERREDSEFGRFGWVMDPEENRIELWEPPKEQSRP